MRTIKIVTRNYDGKGYACWFTTNTLIGFRNFSQYILDSMSNPEKFMIWDVDSNLVYDFYKTVTRWYGMRKRTFTERMNDVQTGIWTQYSDMELADKECDIVAMVNAVNYV